MGKKKDKGPNMNEIYFEWWLDSLKKVGLVSSYTAQPETFVVIENISVDYLKHYKTKAPLWKQVNVSPVLVWTPDYVVHFHKSVINKLLGVISTDSNILIDYTEEYPGSKDFDNVYQETLFYSMHTQEKDDWIEVWFDAKPPANAIRFSGALGSSRDFRYLMPLMIEKHQIFVNKVVPIQLFDKTFMPDRYRFTDGGTMTRKINKKFRTVEEWMNLKKIQKP